MAKPGRHPLWLPPIIAMTSSIITIKSHSKLPQLLCGLFVVTKVVLYKKNRSI